jgi:transcriptional regulator with XRE-family HTH domain
MRGAVGDLLVRNCGRMVYDRAMALKTTAFEAAEAKGWTMAELAKRSGVPVMTLYSLRRGHRSIGPKVIPGIMRAFPDLPFERLFLPADSAIAHTESTIAEPLAAA